MNRNTGMWKWPRNPKFLAVGAAAVTLMLMLYSFYPVSYPSALRETIQNSYEGLSPREQAGNATIGFQRILALSAYPSWRTRGMKAAADIAHLEIETPIQPPITEEMVHAFKEIGSSNPGIRRPAEGSAKAWLAHLDLIKYAVASGFESTFIIEDDVDWDITIRDQMKLVSDNVRTFTSTEQSDPLPYGSSWDVLWVGHCGEVTHPDTVRLEYQDDSLIPTELYAGWSKKHLKNIKEGYRAVQKTKQTVCTFGYGLSKSGARNVLRVMGKGQYEAFDVGMMQACGQDLLRCITLQPELMHHYNPKDGTGYVSPNDEANGNRESSAEEAFESLKGTTANMKNSARCAALFHDVCLQPPTRAEDY